MNYRDHTPIPIDKFEGLWDRGSKDEVPLGHFTDCENVKFFASGSFRTRDGIGISQDVGVPLSDVKRIYNYPTRDANTEIVLVLDDMGVGQIYHVVNSTTVYGPILSIDGMTDFAFQPYAGRGYISPFSSSLPVTEAPASAPVGAPVVGAGVEAGIHLYAYTYVTATGESTQSPTLSVNVIAGPNQQVDLTNILPGPGATARKLYRSEAGLTQLKLLATIADNTTLIYSDTTPDASLGANVPTANTATLGTLTIEKGLQNEFLYVYAGDGTPARKAAGVPLSGTMTIANGAAGHTDAGLHVFGFVSETISGYLSAPGLLKAFTTNAAQSVSFGAIPTSGDPNVIARHLVATTAITNYNGDVTGYQLFFVPGATIPNNTDTFLNNISFYDQDLLDDASHLLDNYSEIPAGATLSLYHNRLCLSTTFNDISIVLVSAPGEPEAINQITGLIVVTLDGNPITQTAELRDVLYVMKRARTISYVDNGDEPASWPDSTIDNALGCPVHGVATVLDSGRSSVDFLIVTTYQGISLFNGKYQEPELSWKIEAFWQRQDRNEFRRIQIVNAPIQKEIYVVLPDRRILVGNYGNGMESMKMRWAPWSYLPGVNTIAIVNIDEIVIGADLPE